MLILLWLLTLAGALLGGVTLIEALLADSAPKQGAAAAMAAALAVIPYCLARAALELSKSGHDVLARDLATVTETMKVHTKLLAALANATPPAEKAAGGE